MTVPIVGRPRPLVGALVTLALATGGCGDAGDVGGRRATDGNPGAAVGSPTSGAEPVAPAIATSDYRARRARIVERLSDGILLLHARPAEKAADQWGFVQDPTFLYYTGLAETPAAIVALDGVSGEAHLFLPPPPRSFGMTVQGLVPAPGPETADRHGFDSARPWTDFQPWLRERLDQGVETLYVDGSRRPEATGVPPGMSPTSGHHTLWRTALERAFPSIPIRSARAEIVEQRAVKSDREIRILERNARMTATSLLAVAEHLEPGVRQRETEAVMVKACIDAGGQGPSFWPWTMSGPNAHFDRLVGVFFRYDQADREARAGELVRVDIGCAGGGYGADVGRTLPVSGRFTPGQAEAWSLLITGYRAGLDAMADGVPITEVRAASATAVDGAASSLRTPEGRAALDAIRAGGEGTWHIHGVGLDSGEDLPEVLRAGMVLAYEPGFAVGEDAYYLEDMIAVTGSGHRVLSAGLPYGAVEIEAIMGRE